MKPFHSGLTGRVVAAILEKLTDLVVAAMTGFVAWFLWTKVRGPRSKKKAATGRRVQPARKKKRPTKARARKQKGSKTKVRRKGPEAVKPRPPAKKQRKANRKIRARKVVRAKARRERAAA